jgi:hypothetical protein
MSLGVSNVIYLQAIGSNLSILQAYGLAGIAFMIIPAALAGGASLYMRKKEDAS